MQLFFGIWALIGAAGLWYLVNHTRLIGGLFLVLTILAWAAAQPWWIIGLLGAAAVLTLATTRWWATTLAGCAAWLAALISLVHIAWQLPVVWLVVAGWLVLALDYGSMRFAPAWRLARMAQGRLAPPAGAQTSGCLSDGTRYIQNVVYGKRPQSTLDLYYPAHPNGKTALLVHGGGFLWGNLPKPETLVKDGPGTYQHQLLAHGYTVAQIDYARTPQSSHPVALQQLVEAVQFLQAHRQALAVPMDQLLFGGTSAGASLVGQFINAQCDPAWAATCAIPQVVSPTQLTGVIFASGLLDISQFGVTHGLKTDYLFTHMGRLYAGVDDLKHASSVAAMDVLPRVSAAWPPVFLSDGNHGTFYDQAKRLATKLQALAVPCTLVWFARSEAQLGHTFEKGHTPQAQAVRKQLDAWLNKRA
ncbi:alpha/beta hydrolase [Lacticaseibacillus jixiensis]|uniref:alpha/beta hydrolase n=1 Tax=Lacticaseibacillus jixiensis TaxID=3231926 RepID=UPI0036F2309E